MGGLTFGKVYITPLEVAKAIGWYKDGDGASARVSAYRKAVRWLEEEGCLVVRAGKKVTTRDALKAAFPEVWEEFEMRKFEREDE